MEAESGEQALEALAKQRPDLILMDIQLPVMDGYEVTRRIKADRCCVRSRSSRSLPMRSVGKNKRRGPLAVANMCLNPTARVNCWRKSVSTYPEPIEQEFLLECCVQLTLRPIQIADDDPPAVT